MNDTTQGILISMLGGVLLAIVAGYFKMREMAMTAAVNADKARGDAAQAVKDVKGQNEKLDEVHVLVDGSHSAQLRRADALEAKLERMEKLLEQRANLLPDGERQIAQAEMTLARAPEPYKGEVVGLNDVPPTMPEKAP